MGEEAYIVHVTVNRWQQSLFSLMLSVTKFLILERTEVSERSFSFVLCEGTCSVLVVYDKKYPVFQIEIYCS